MSDERLALRGGTPVRSVPLPRWPPAPSPEAIAELLEVLSGSPPASGPRPWQMVHKRAFEEEFATYCGTPYAVAVSSGTSALDLVVEALDLAAGGVVVAANFGHPSTIQQAAGRHRLLLLDVDPDTLCLSPGELGEALGRSEVRCVLTTHFAGQPGGIEQLMQLCVAAGVPLVEDASHAHGAQVAGRRVGSLGRAGCFSLHVTKTMGVGEGGVVTTADEALFRRIWRLHDIGRDPDSAPYLFVERGGNHRLSEPSSVLARHRLRALEAENARRHASVETLRRALGDDSPLRILPLGEGVELHAHHFLAARYHAAACSGLSRQRFILALCAEGIPCNGGWPSVLSQLPPFAQSCESHPTPVAEAACREMVWFDQRLLLEEQGVEQMLEAVHKIQRLSRSVGGRR